MAPHARQDIRVGVSLPGCSRFENPCERHQKVMQVWCFCCFHRSETRRPLGPCPKSMTFGARASVIRCVNGSSFMGGARTPASKRGAANLSAVGAFRPQLLIVVSAGAERLSLVLVLGWEFLCALLPRWLQVRACLITTSSAPTSGRWSPMENVQRL